MSGGYGVDVGGGYANKEDREATGLESFCSQFIQEKLDADQEYFPGQDDPLSSHIHALIKLRCHENQRLYSALKTGNLSDVEKILLQSAPEPSSKHFEERNLRPKLVVTEERLVQEPVTTDDGPIRARGPVSLTNQSSVSSDVRPLPGSEITVGIKVDLDLRSPEVRESGPGDRVVHVDEGGYLHRTRREALAQCVMPRPETAGYLLLAASGAIGLLTVGVTLLAPVSFI